MNVNYSGWLEIPDTQRMLDHLKEQRIRLLEQCEGLAGDADNERIIMRKLAQSIVYRELIKKYTPER
jgi:hypothetical protein